MESKNLRGVIQWQIFNVRNELLMSKLFIWHTIILNSKRYEVISQNLLSVEFLKQTWKHSSVSIISHSTPIIAFSSQIFQSLERDSIIRICEHVKLLNADWKIWNGEIILDVPT